MRSNALLRTVVSPSTTVLSIATDAYHWIPGDADWDVGVPQVSERASVNEARQSRRSCGVRDINETPS